MHGWVWQFQESYGPNRPAYALFAFINPHANVLPHSCDIMQAVASCPSMPDDNESTNPSPGDGACDPDRSFAAWSMHGRRLVQLPLSQESGHDPDGECQELTGGSRVGDKRS